MQWVKLLNTKISIYRAIYIKVLSDVTVSYLTVFTSDVLNATNKETSFPELRNLYEEVFDIKYQ